MSKTGSLIQLHHHDNYEVLEQLADKDGILYYKDAPVFPSVSKKENNGIVLETDGLYMSNVNMLSNDQYNLVSRFSYKNGSLYFDSTIVSQEYTNSQIQMMIDDLWNELEPKEDTGESESGGDTSDPTES